MKLSLISIAILIILFYKANAQSNNTSINVFIGVAEKQSNIEEGLYPKPGETPSLIGKDPSFNLHVLHYPEKTKVKFGSTLVLRFSDNNQKLLTIGEVDKNMEVDIVTDTGKHLIIKRNVSNQEYEMTDLNIPLKPLQRLTLADSTILDIQIKINCTSCQIPSPDNTVMYTTTHFEAYQGIGKNLWIPTFLFSSNFKGGVNGIPFASLPIGFAIGEKYYFSKNFFLGASFIGTYLLYTGTDNTPTQNATISQTTTSFNVLAASGGVLFDLNNSVFLGATYGLNFQGKANPGLMFVIGVSPTILSKLVGKAPSGQ